MTFKENGGAYIAGLIRKAVEDELYTCTVSGNWEIEQPIRIPSGFTLVLDGCHLRMKDGTMCNMFVNEHLDCENNAIRDYDICIEGRGRAILDGGEPNGLNEKSFKANPEAFPGIPGNSVNNLILFVNVDGIRIHGLQLRNQRWWAMNFIYCCHGILRNLEFRANATRVDKDGKHVIGLIKKDTASCLVKNADGIDLRCGCHDFIIENITGFTQDDTIALTAMQGKMEKRYRVEGMATDICNVIIRNINTAAYCANVRLLNRDHVKLHDILIDGVFDASRDCRFMDTGGNHVLIGCDPGRYGTIPSQPGELYNITVRNVHSTGSARTVDVAEMADHLQLENIYRS